MELATGPDQRASATIAANGHSRYVRPSASTVMALRFRGVGVIACLVALAGCHLYGNVRHQSDDASFRSPTSSAHLSVVEVDDRGGFWSAGQPGAAISAVRSAAEAGATVTVLFIHGWDHDASTEDQNLVCFSHTLDYLSKKLNTTSSPTKRAFAARTSTVAPANAEIHVEGVYVGWRGKSLPNFPSVLDVFQKVATFWGRKSAATRVGRGDLRSFLDALEDVYIHANYDTTADHPLFGLVTVGHSFGGQVLFPAIQTRIEDQLQQADAGEAWQALRQKPISPRTPKFVEGLGDLVILVNPAFESAAYERMFRLERQLDFPKAQTPVLAVVSADNDVPRHFLFPIGRFFASTFRARSEPGNWERDQVVLGRYDPQVTHRLEWTAPPNAPLQAGTAASSPDLTGSASGVASSTNVRDNPFTESAEGCDYSNPPAEVGPDELRDSIEKAINGNGSPPDASASWSINGKSLSRVAQKDRHNTPLMVVRTQSHDILDGHSGFFQAGFVDFLIRYVDDVEAIRWHHLPERKAAFRARSAR